MSAPTNAAQGAVQPSAFAGTGTCPEHRQILEAVARCEQDLLHFQEDSPEHDRARQILTGLAGRLREAAEVFDIDPTLADEPFTTGRFRALELLAELARQIPAGLRNATSGRMLTLAGATHDAARLPHRAAEVGEIMEIALRLHQVASSLEAVHCESQEALAAAMWPDRERVTQ